MSHFIGPALPPHLKQNIHDSSDDEVNIKSKDINIDCASKSSSSCSFKTKNECKQSNPNADESAIGPALPASTCLPDSQLVFQNLNNIGPELPPYLKNNDPKHSNVDREDEAEDINQYVGPSLPPHLRDKGSDTPDTSSSNSSSYTHFKHIPDKKSDINFTEGPTLPPQSHLNQVSDTSDDENSALVLNAAMSDDCHDQSNDGEEMYGPALPPGLKTNVSASKAIRGPFLPPTMKLSELQEDSESDDDIIGPMPVPMGSENSTTYLQDQLEKRALKMKRKLAGEDEDGGTGVPKREDWMLELPPDRAADFGLGPRQFRTRARLDLGDRSVWTETPSDKLQKLKTTQEPQPGHSSEMEQLAIRTRNEHMEKLARKQTKKQDSLLNMHQKELKKKKKNEEDAGKKKVRRPFDRDIDLQVNRFDEAQKKAIFKKAQLLNDRFSTGERKFL